jgi:hypothetical protein
MSPSKDSTPPQGAISQKEKPNGNQESKEIKEISQEPEEGQEG